MGLGDEAAVDVEAFVASEQGGVGLVVADLGVEGGLVGLGNVGRVADDGIVGGFVGDGGEEVGLEEGDAVGHVVGFGVDPSDFEGFGGDVEGSDAGLGEVDGQRDGDGSGAGANVGDAEGKIVGEAVENCFDKVLGLGAGDEDSGSDLEWEAIKLLLAGDVLDGLVFQAAGDVGFVEGLIGG